MRSSRLLDVTDGPDTPIPVYVLTGFLGSGKTTLLAKLLARPEFADTAVLINEFGEVGLDHLIAREVSEDVVLLDSGCLCCSAGDDLASTLLELYHLRHQADAPAFNRVVIETSGLADPGPVLTLVMTDRRLNTIFEAGPVLTVIDAINGAENITRFPEAEHQLGLADTVVISKTDLVPPDLVTMLEQQIKAINAHAVLVDSETTRDPFRYFDGPRALPDTPVPHGHDEHPHHDHSGDIGSFVVQIEDDVDWPRFVTWLELLLSARGKSILRVKGLLAVHGEHRPLVLQAVQTMVYPPQFLPRWPADVRASQIVFIARDLTAAAIETSLRKHVLA
ncbi:MAG: GTP-binding protein [Rhizobiales bacterium]|nr:GTP-binding protein [Hyphomicrobiales bacterium]